MDAVSMWVDHSRVGCGERCFLVLRTGRKWVKLHNPAMLATITVPIDDFRRARKTPCDAARLLRQHRRTRRLWRRLGLAVPKLLRA